MNRRTYLAGLAACGVPAGLHLLSNRSPEYSTLEVTTVEVSGLADTDLSIEATIDQPMVTTDQTAQITFTATWSADPNVMIAYGSGIPFDCPLRSVDPRGLLLVMSQLDAQRKRGTDRWVPNGSAISAHEARKVLWGWFNPSGTQSMRWEVWADPETGADWIRPGEYRFTDSFTIDERSADLSVTVNVAGVD